MDRPENSDSVYSILNEIKRSIYSEDVIEIKKHFSRLIDLSSYILSNGHKIPNFLFLACKNNRIDFVEYLLSDVVVKFITTNNKTFYSPEDKDDSCHNIFYYSIRNSNVSLVDSLIRKWPENYLRMHPDKLEYLLGYPYYELLLNNVFLTHEIQVFIERQLLDIRFNKPNTHINIQNHDFIEKHISYLIAHITNVLESTKADEKSLFSITCVAKHIYILKRLLKCTYDKILWEEMEFCLSCFICSYKKIEEINIFYKYYFSFQKIQSHLSHFITDIKHLLQSVNTVDLKTIGVLPEKSRSETIMESTESESLIKDHQIVRDIYSLEKITEALILAVSVDASTREGKLVIYRSLQIAGENLKYTMEAPKLSNKTSDFLLIYLPYRTKKIIMELRNSLSHSYSLEKRLELEKDPDSFCKLQKDLKKVLLIVQEVLLIKKDNVIFEIVAKMSQVSSIAEMVQLLEILKASDINNMYQIIHKFGKESFFDDEKLVDLIGKLNNLINPKTEYEEKLFRDAYEIIEVNSSNFFAKKQAYLLKILHLLSIKNAFFDTELHEDTFELIKNVAYVIRRHNIPVLKLEEDLAFENSLFTHLWKDSLSLQTIVSKIIVSASIRIEKDDLESALTLETDIFDISFLDKVIVEELDEVWEKISKKTKKSSSAPAEKFDLSMCSKSILIELESIFVQKGITFKNGIKVPFESDVKKLQVFKSVAETLFLDLLSILQSTNNLSSTSSSVEDKPFIMFGKDLRNHLAHGNVLFDALTNLDSLDIVIMNVVKYIQSEQQQSKLEVLNINSSLSDNCNESLRIVTNKCNLFSSLERGNLENVTLYIQNGADILSRDYDLNNCLHYASKSTSEVVQYLLQQNSWTRFKNIYGQSPLHVAAKHGKNNAITLLLENGFSVNEIVSGRSALHFAAMNGHSDTVELLLKNNAITSIKDKEGFMPLHYAVKFNSLDVVSKLLQNDEVNSNLCYSSYSLLHIASQYGHFGLVNYLISRKANVNCKSDTGQTPLHVAATEGYLDIVKELIFNGAFVDGLTLSNETPLLYACEGGNIEIVDFLLQKGAQIDSSDFHNMSPLYCASKNGHCSVVDILLKNGANVNIRYLNDIIILNKNAGVKVTPFLEAVFRGHIKVVETFIKYGINVNASVDNYTAMHLVAMVDSEELISVLLKNKASVTDKTNTGLTPLHIASREDNCKIIKILLENCADIDAKDENGSTPLHEAVSIGRVAAVALLIESNADINVLNNSNLSPLHIAVYIGSDELVKILLLHKAYVNIGISHSAFSPLHLACMYGLNNIVDLLLISGGTLEINETLGFNALKVTIQGGHIAVIETLLNNKINFSSYNLENIILESIKNNRRNILELILKSVERSKIIPTLPKMLSLSILLGFNGIFKFIFNKFRKEVFDSIKELADKSNHTIDISINKAPLNYSDPLNHLNSSSYFKYNEANLKLLHLACLKGNNEIVNFLLLNKFLVNNVSLDGTTPLHLAALHNKLELSTSLVTFGAKVNAEDVSKWTPLHVTVSQGNLNLLLFLIEKGSDINAKTNDGFKPIHIATANGHNKIIEHLLSSGVDAEELGPLNLTLVHIAAARGQMSVLKLLIEINCDLNGKDVHGYSAIHLAAINDHRNALEYLVNAGSIFNSVDITSKTALNYSANEEIQTILKSTQALFRSVKNNNLNDVERSIKKGALINAIDSNYASALHYAAWRGFHKVVFILLNNKCNLNIVGKNGFTPLHYAAQFHQYRVVVLILSNGGMYNILSGSQKTPLDLAKDKKIVDLLQYVNNCFTKIEQGDLAIIDLLKEESNSDYNKVIWKTKNTDNKNIISVAVKSNFPETRKLKHLILRDFSLDIINAKRLHLMNHFDEALELYKQILNSKNEFLDSSDPDVIYLEIAIAELLREKEEFSSSLKLHQSIYEKLQPIRTKDHKELLECRIKIAVVMHKLGKYDTSLAILKDVYKIQRANFKINYPSILNTMLNIVYVLTEIGNLEEALEMNDNIIAWGTEQPIFNTANCSRAKILKGLGRCDEAYQIYKTEFERSIRLRGPYHSSTLKLLHNIAVLYPKQNSEALKMLFDVIKIQKNNSPNHDIYMTYFNIAIILLEDGNLFRSLQVFKVCYEIGHNLFHNEHPEILQLEAKIESIKLMFISVGYSIDELLEKINDNLFTAVKKEDLNSLKGLIEKGVCVDEQDGEGRTLLHYAVSNGSIEIINTLLEHGANVNISTYKGNNLLHIAALYNRYDLMEIILAHVSEYKKYSFVNGKTKISGKTPLHVAAEKGFLNSVSCLLNHGSSQNICDANGKTPLDLAKDRKTKHLINFFIGFNSEK